MTHRTLINIVLLLCLTAVVQKTTAEEIPVSGRAEAEFQANSDPIQPVDPGEKEIEIEAKEPPTKGPLSINYVSTIEFGQQRLTDDRQELFAKNDTITQVVSGEKKNYPNFIQITDLRGTAAGWRLSVKQNGPLRTSSGVELLGASLAIRVDSVISQYQMKQTPSYLLDKQGLNSEGETFQELVHAEQGTGISTWNIYLGSEIDASKNVTLNVLPNQNNQAGRYTTSLTWLLSDGL